MSDVTGWSRYKVGGATRYLHDSSGMSVSNYTFMQLKKKYGTDIPLEAVEEAQKKPDPRYFGVNASRATRAQRLNVPQKEKKFATPDEEYEEEPIVQLNMPEPKLNSNRGGRPSGNSATTKELEAAFKINMIIVTSICSLLTGIPDIEMTQAEANAIAIPAANLFEKTDFNKRFGRMLAGSGDYSLLGYALYLYVHRVSLAINQRGGLFNGRSHKSTKREVRQPEPTNNGVAADIHRGANLPVSLRATSARWASQVAQPG